MADCGAAAVCCESSGSGFVSVEAEVGDVSVCYCVVLLVGWAVGSWEG